MSAHLKSCEYLCDERMVSVLSDGVADPCGVTHSRFAVSAPDCLAWGLNLGP